MIYSLFFKKTESDLAPYPSVAYVQSLIKKCKHPFLIGWPGYISKSKVAIDNFYKKLNPFIKTNLNGFFFRPMSVIAISPGLTNEDYMNKVFGGFSLPQVKKLDHSKILVILDMPNGDKTNYCDEIIKHNYFVKGVLIGSSNLSNNTYFVSPTQKGEADVLFFEVGDGVASNPDDFSIILQFFQEQLVSDLRENKNIIVTKQINAIEYDLKEIVDSLLNLSN